MSLVLLQNFKRIQNQLASDGSESPSVGANLSIKKHRKTLEKLEKYDTGEIQKSKDLARYSSVQSYLRDIQRKSAQV